jgi:hypothetical protein
MKRSQPRPGQPARAVDPASPRSRGRDRPSVRLVPVEQRISPGDDLRPVSAARGIVIGLALSAVIWAAIIVFFLV